MDRLPLDLTAARTARDAGMTAAVQHADPAWLEQARAAVHLICLTRRTWIVDDVWEAGLPRPKEARAIGPVLQRALRDGWCVKSREYRQSAQPQCHCNPRRVWVSRLYIAGAA